MRCDDEGNSLMYLPFDTGGESCGNLVIFITFIRISLPTPCEDPLEIQLTEVGLRGDFTPRSRNLDQECLNLRLWRECRTFL